MFMGSILRIKVFGVNVEQRDYNNISKYELKYTIPNPICWKWERSTSMDFADDNPLVAIYPTFAEKLEMLSLERLKYLVWMIYIIPFWNKGLGRIPQFLSTKTLM